MNNPIVLAIVLQALGVGVIVAELVIPSAGLLTVSAFALFGYSLYVVFAHVSPSVGVWFVTADIILVPMLVYLGIQALGRSRLSLRSSLKREEGVSSQNLEQEKLKGAFGTTITACRPAGRALIGGKKYDVVSGGDFLEQGMEIVVKEVNGNRIVIGTKNA